MKPKVSVLIPVHNGEKYLRPAIDSILNQTFSDFELIIIDDGSTDHSREIVEAYADPRIRLASNQTKSGLARTLNKGIELAAGSYIARMDGDDISLPERLARQVAFMDAHPQVGACGTFARDIDPQGKVFDDRQRLVGQRLEYFYWIPVPIAHPTSMVRADLLKKLRYDENVRVEDYDLWLRIVKAGYRLSNIPEYLLLYRVHEASFTSTTKNLFEADYEIFCTHVGNDVLSYAEFEALFQGACVLSPAQRGAALSRVARAIRKPGFFFFRDNLSYTKRWLADRAYKLLISKRALRPIRLLLRRIKSLAL